MKKIKKVRDTVAVGLLGAELLLGVGNGVGLAKDKYDEREIRKDEVGKIVEEQNVKVNALFDGGNRAIAGFDSTVPRPVGNVAYYELLSARPLESSRLLFLMHRFFDGKDHSDNSLDELNKEFTSWHSRLIDYMKKNKSDVRTNTIKQDDIDRVKAVVDGVNQAVLGMVEASNKRHLPESFEYRFWAEIALMLMLVLGTRHAELMGGGVAKIFEVIERFKMSKDFRVVYSKLSLLVGQKIISKDERIAVLNRVADDLERILDGKIKGGVEDAKVSYRVLPEEGKKENFYFVEVRKRIVEFRKRVADDVSDLEEEIAIIDEDMKKGVKLDRK